MFYYPYLAGWAADRDISVLRESMDLIRTTSGQVIEGMMEVFKEHELIKDQDLEIEEAKDHYEIWQIDPDGKAKDRMFLGSEYLSSHGVEISMDDYRQVYKGELKEQMTLDGIYETFNIDHPDDYKGHSLSVGDIVVLHKAGKEQAFFVDIIGFKELPVRDKALQKEAAMNMLPKDNQIRPKELAMRR